MAKTPNDVTALLAATAKARSTIVEGPMITLCMGEIGVITRLVGGNFGSDLTFAIGKESSAPVQVSVEYLREFWNFTQKKV